MVQHLEYLLLFQKTLVQFLAPMLSSQSLVIPVPEDSDANVLFWLLKAPGTHTVKEKYSYT